MSDESTRLVCAVRVEDAVNRMCERVDQLSMVLNLMIRLPLSAGIIAGATWMFYQQKIAEQTWLIVGIVALFPFYGDAMRELAAAINKWRGGGGGKDAAIAAAKLVAFGALSLAAVLGGHA